MPKMPTEQHYCLECGKPTSRLFGFSALADVGDGKKELKVDAIGYCMSHRDTVQAVWESSLGGTDWVAEEPIELRSRDARRFVEEVRIALAGGLGGVHEMPADGSAPSACPHCGARIYWGVGPHAQDQLVIQDRAFAWECSGCGAAGLLQVR